MVVVNTYQVGFGLRIETGAERTTIEDISDIIQQVRDTGIHLKALFFCCCLLFVVCLTLLTDSLD